MPKELIGKGKDPHLYCSSGSREECNRRLYNQKTQLLSELKRQDIQDDKQTAYLMRLIEAEENVLCHPERIEWFLDPTFFLKVAQYNICKRTIKTLNGVVSSRDLYQYLLPNLLEIKQGMHLLSQTTLVHYHFGGENQKPVYIFYEEAQSPKEQMEWLDHELILLKAQQKNLVPDTLGKQEPNEKRIGGIEAKTYYDATERIQKLNYLRNEIVKSGNPKSRLLEKVSSTLQEEFNVTFDLAGNAQGIGWIDIHKQKVKTIETSLR